MEAKAGETLGPAVAQYRRAAEKREAAGKPTNAPARLDALLPQFVSQHDPRSERVEELRYQLLTAVAGTLAAAKGSVNHAVLMLHEFLTDDRISRTERYLYLFVTTVFDFEPPRPEAPAPRERASCMSNAPRLLAMLAGGIGRRCPSSSN